MPGGIMKFPVVSVHRLRIRKPKKQSRNCTLTHWTAPLKTKKKNKVTKRNIVLYWLCTYFSETEETEIFEIQMSFMTRGDKKTVLDFYFTQIYPPY